MKKFKNFKQISLWLTIVIVEITRAINTKRIIAFSIVKPSGVMSAGVTRKLEGSSALV